LDERADDVIAGVRRALKPGGALSAECGGIKCVATIETALLDALQRRGITGKT